MRISFEMPDSTAELLRRSADRISLNTGRDLTVSEIAKALVHEVLIDDATEHGLCPDAQSRH